MHYQDCTNFTEIILGQSAEVEAAKCLGISPKSDLNLKVILQLHCTRFHLLEWNKLFLQVYFEGISFRTAKITHRNFFVVERCRVMNTFYD